MQQRPTSQPTGDNAGNVQGKLLRAQPLSEEPSTPQPARPVPIGTGAAANAADAKNTAPAAVPTNPSPTTPTTPATPTTAGGLAAPVLLTPEQLAARQGAQAIQEHGWSQGRKATGVREEIDERAEEGSLGLMWRDFIAQHRSWSVSMLVHAALLLLLALLTFSLPDSGISLLSTSDVSDDIDEMSDLLVETPPLVEVGGDIVDRPEPEPLEPKIDMQKAAEGINAMSQQLIDHSSMFAPENDLLNDIGMGTGNLDRRGTGKGKKGTGHGLNGSGRGLGGRGGRRGPGNGATVESELAVDLALKWLAEHQMPDGGWSFNHSKAASCQGKCPNDGSLVESRIAATAYGLLPFLGAGETNLVGRHKNTVARGLQYLMNNAKLGNNGADLTEGGGRMYSQGLATIALCEAFGMQASKAIVRKQEYEYFSRYGGKDLTEFQKAAVAAAKAQKPIPLPKLGPVAQSTLNFVQFAQDKNGGGWRYTPGEAGDTSVVGWQLMGLISGRLAGLYVHPVAFRRANGFLDHVQANEYGSDYGYTDPAKATKATQSIGLLSRMYLGWDKGHQGIIEGVNSLGTAGPKHGYMYYDYYATQVMHHYGGPAWEKWNEVMREDLVGSQSKAGHTEGSWHFPGGDRGASHGGRLYDTAMSAMTLEVYYRHLPLYGEGALQQAPKEEEKDPIEEIEEID